ncbi:MAG: hypothetical protein HYZ34_14860 [Ignavibacteriae bacterium]|nr:hypothetical protein [Ignavibacteriota bacterium]
MPDNNGRLIELVAELVIENRKTNEQLKMMDDHLGTMNGKLGSMDVRLERLEKQQAKTNVLMLQVTRDLVKIAELLDERVVHWGDKIHIQGKQSVTGVVSKEA